jgi:hypothetical protein
VVTLEKDNPTIFGMWLECVESGKINMAKMMARTDNGNFHYNGLYCLQLWRLSDFLGDLATCNLVVNYLFDKLQSTEMVLDGNGAYLAVVMTREDSALQKIAYYFFTFLATKGVLDELVANEKINKKFLVSIMKLKIQWEQENRLSLVVSLRVKAREAIAKYRLHSHNDRYPRTDCQVCLDHDQQQSHRMEEDDQSDDQSDERKEDKGDVVDGWQAVLPVAMSR